MDAYDDEPDPAPAAHRGRCGKARYGSHHAAKSAMRALQRNGRSRSYEGRLHPYPCPICRAWHVGHTYRTDH